MLFLSRVFLLRNHCRSNYHIYWIIAVHLFLLFPLIIITTHLFLFVAINHLIFRFGCDDNGWAEGELHGIRGWFPFDRVEFIEESASVRFQLLCDVLNQNTSNLYLSIYLLYISIFFMYIEIFSKSISISISFSISIPLPFNLGE